jgi:hypothetical protein
MVSYPCKHSVTRFCGLCELEDHQRGQQETSTLQKVNELKTSWERQVQNRNNIAWNDHDAGMGEQLAQCLKELQEALNAIPTHHQPK